MTAQQRRWLPASRAIAATVFVTACSTGAGPLGTVGEPVEEPGSAPAPTVEQGMDLVVAARRAAHTATTLPNGDVLVAGGCVTDGCGTATADTFLVHGTGPTVAAGPPMVAPRDSHTATLTSDGLVVLAGGFGGEGEAPLGSIEVFDSATGVWSSTAELSVGRGGHAAASAGDGRVVFAGGWVGRRTYTSATELFDPTTRRVERGPDLPVAADALDAVALADGRVLVTGGQVSPGTATPAASVFDGRQWVEVGPLLTARFKHTSVLLGDGRVLVMGGTPDDRTLLTSTEIFDPVTGDFSPGPDLAEPRYKMTGGAVALGDHRVVVAGGGRTIEILDVAAGTSTIVDSLAARGSFATANLLGSDRVLVIGGYDDDIALRQTAHIFEVAELLDGG